MYVEVISIHPPYLLFIQLNAMVVALGINNQTETTNPRTDLTFTYHMDYARHARAGCLSCCPALSHHAVPLLQIRMHDR